LPLRFDAPLTVVVADNGTGKTSLCDALEWLLTGQVERLVRERVGANQLAHIDAAGEVTAVEALVLIDQKEVRLTRTLSGNASKLSSTTPGWKKLADAKLLETLTPKRIGLGVHAYKKTSARAGWLRAVRFLTPDNLTQLIDRNEKSEEVRGRLFAALFGAGELKESVRNLEKLIDEFRLPEKDVQQCEARIKSSELTLQALRDEAVAPYFERFGIVGQELAAAIGLPWRLTDNLRAQSGQFLSLEEAVISGERELERRQLRIGELETDLPRLQTAAASHKKWISESCPLLAAQAKSLRSTLEPLRKAVVDLSRDTETARRQQVAAARAVTRFDEVAGRLNVWADAWSRAESDSAAPIDFTRLQQDFSTAEHEASRLREMAATLNELGQAIGAESEALRGLAELQAKRTALLNQIGPESTQRDLARRHAEAAGRISALRRQRDAEVDRWQRWVSEARGFIEHRPGQVQCPLCGHDHGTPDAFSAAVRHILSEAPVETNLTRDLAGAEQSLRLLATDQERSETARSQMKVLDDEIARRVARAQAFQLRCQGVQMPADLLQSPRAQQLLTDAATALNRQLEINRVRAASLRTKLQLAEEWRLLTNTASSLGEFLPPDARLLLAQPPALASSPTEWLVRFGKARPAASASHHSTEGLTTRLEKELDAARKQASEIEVQLQEVDRKLKTGEEAAKADELAVKRGHEQAKSIGAEDFNESALETVRREIHRQAQKVAEARTKLEILRKHLKDATLAENNHLQRQRISVELGQLRGEQRFFEAKRAMRKEIEAEIAARTVRLDEWIRNESEPLQRVINALFLRAQGVAYIDQILPDETGTSGRLNWKGAVDGARSLLTAELSQGQRQDLALSIFLARAMHEGGTFVLDEPLAHLDDVNRLAVLDSLRTLVVSRPAEDFRLILTTASWALARHLRAKFFHIRTADNRPALKVIPLVGDPRRGVAEESKNW
jgi:DNA repair exonuclease SbcCD ATPase subunit